MDVGRHEGEGPPDGVGFDVEQVIQPNSNEAEGQARENQVDHAPGLEDERKRERKHQRKHRRVKTDPVPGSDPNPQPEPPRHSDSENDERLKADKPPHWG